MLVISRKAEEAVLIEVGGQIIEMLVTKIEHGAVKLAFDADENVKIIREEIADIRELTNSALSAT